MKPSERVWHVGEEMDPETEMPTGVVDRQAMHELLADLEAVLFRIGGQVHIAVDREKYAELTNGDGLFETRGYFVQWRAFAPARTATNVEQVDAIVGEDPDEGVLDQYEAAPVEPAGDDGRTFDPASHFDIDPADYEQRMPPPIVEEPDDDEPTGPDMSSFVEQAGTVA